MKKSLIIGLIIIVIFGLGFGIKSIFFSSKAKAEIEEEVINADIEETESKKDNTEKQEKTLEQKEREIEATKLESKIKIKPLKDASSGKEFYELEDAPLQYAVDGVSYFLKENPEKITITKELTEDDIKRIQSYGYNWHTGYVNEVEPNSKYGEYYNEYPEDTETAIKQLIPQRLEIYQNALVGWVTEPNLVYITKRGYYGVSGVLQLSYLREDNVYKLSPGKGYERDVEFRYSNNTDGLFLTEIIYLSDWREFESWQNPYK